MSSEGSGQRRRMYHNHKIRETLQENPLFPTEFSVGKHEIPLLKRSANRITNGKNCY